MWLWSPRWNKGGFAGSDLNSAAIGGREVLVWRQVVLKSELYEIFLAVISGLIAFWGKRINAIFSVCFPILVVLNLIDPESDQGWATRKRTTALSYRDRQSPWRRGSSVIGDAIRMPPGLASAQYLYLVARLAEKKREAFPEASQAPPMFDNFMLYLFRHVRLSTNTGFSVWARVDLRLGVAALLVVGMRALKIVRLPDWVWSGCEGPVSFSGRNSDHGAAVISNDWLVIRWCNRCL